MESSSILGGGILALVLVAGGLVSSTFHLANPKNAWRAFFRFKTSWLSREGVFAVLFFPFALLYLLGVWVSEGSNALVALFGVIAVVLAILTVFATGMIYACLKTIRQWNTALTPTNYLLLGLATGAVLLVMVLLISGKSAALVAGMAALLLVLAGVAKAVYYYWLQTVTGPTLKTATGFTRAQVRLLDTGHTAGTFLTDEFGYQVDDRLRTSLKLLVFIFGILLPLLMMAAVASGVGGTLSGVLAALSALVGVGVERWLFFAEARHVVNLYHGAQHT
ncbi:MAG: DmsC/YnfH family molybdoenzyme membrane anchor subunit [Thiolinea sp.]